MNQKTAEIEFDEKAHVYRVGGRELPSVTQVLKEAGLVDDRWFTEHSAWRGTAVHRALHYYDEGDLNEGTLDLALVPYVVAWRTFRTQSGFTPTLIEHRVVDSMSRYAGTVDRVGVLNSRRVVIDIKSGAITPAAALQTAAYASALEGIQGRFAVHLRDDGTYSLREFKDRSDSAVFFAALSVVQWKRNNA